MTAGLHSFWNLEDILIPAFEQNMISRNTSFSWFTQLTILLKYITESFAKSKPHSPEIFDDTPACYFAIWKNVCFGSWAVWVWVWAAATWEHKFVFV